MFYHFKVHKEGNTSWAQGVELEGCFTQGETQEELLKNLHEALNLHLDEPENSNAVFPEPREKLKGRNIIVVPVDPKIAFAMQVRQSRLRHKLTQKEAAKSLGMKSVYSYQRLESSKTANPEFGTLMRICEAFPEFSVDRILETLPTESLRSKNPSTPSKRKPEKFASLVRATTKDYAKTLKRLA
jgi:antitoxin HicB